VRAGAKPVGLSSGADGRFAICDFGLDGGLVENGRFAVSGFCLAGGLVEIVGDRFGTGRVRGFGIGRALGRVGVRTVDELTDRLLAPPSASGAAGTVGGSVALPSSPPTDSLARKARHSQRGGASRGLRLLLSRPAFDLHRRRNEFDQ